MDIAETSMVTFKTTTVWKSANASEQMAWLKRSSLAFMSRQQFNPPFTDIQPSAVAHQQSLHKLMKNAQLKKATSFLQWIALPESAKMAWMHRSRLEASAV